jgi:hypothetical protein
MNDMKAYLYFILDMPIERQASSGGEWIKDRLYDDLYLEGAERLIREVPNGNNAWDVGFFGGSSIAASAYRASNAPEKYRKQAIQLHKQLEARVKKELNSSS